MHKWPITLAGRLPLQLCILIHLYQYLSRFTKHVWTITQGLAANAQGAPHPLLSAVATICGCKVSWERWVLDVGSWSREHMQRECINADLLLSSYDLGLPCRAFVEKSYLGIKAKNPDLPILIREALGTPPRAFARFGEYI